MRTVLRANLYSALLGGLLAARPEAPRHLRSKPWSCLPRQSSSQGLWSLTTIMAQLTRVTLVSGFGSVLVTLAGGSSTFTGRLEFVGDVGSFWPGFRGDEKLCEVGKRRRT